MSEAVGSVYEAQFLRRRMNDRLAMFRFGDRFEGELPLDRGLPWGLPFRAWEPGTSCG